MKYLKLSEICNPKQWKTLSTEQLLDKGFPVYGANGKIGYYSTYNHELPTIMITCRGATCGSINISEPKSWINGNAMCLDNLSSDVSLKYLAFYLQNYNFNHVISGSAQPQITREGLEKVKVKVYAKELQEKISIQLDKVQKIISESKAILEKYDTLIKFRFIEMFGDLANNTKNWIIKNFTECAIIDTKMIKDFEKYADYPHIGIDSIEKETGVLSGYRTVKEDNVISGKYLFTSEHIIYSKIRPNLNKVAMPNFEGLCSADAYPILVKKNIATREYLTFVMRSDFFVSYILSFSRRANMPKVNKEQVESFNLPLPPFELQQLFSSFVQQIDKSKFAVQKSLEKAETLYKSLMQEYFA